MKKNEILKALWEGRERAVQINVMIILLYLLWDSENVQTMQKYNFKNGTLALP